MRKCSKPDGNKNWVGKRIAELRKARSSQWRERANFAFMSIHCHTAAGYNTFDNSGHPPDKM